MIPYIYEPNWNSIDFPSLQALLVHQSVLLSLLAVCLILVIYKHFRPLAFSISGKSLIKITAITFLAIQMAIQIGNQFTSFKLAQEEYANKTVEQKYQHLFAQYAFSQFVIAQHHADRCSGKLLTNYDPERPLTADLLKYFLYPHVDLINQDNAAECLVIYKKNNALAYVAPEYTDVRPFSKDSLVAFRE